MKNFEIKLENVTIQRNARLILTDKEDGTEIIADLNAAYDLQTAEQKEREFARIYKKLKKDKEI